MTIVARNATERGRGRRIARGRRLQRRWPRARCHRPRRRAGVCRGRRTLRRAGQQRRHRAPRAVPRHHRGRLSVGDGGQRRGHPVPVAGRRPPARCCRPARFDHPHLLADGARRRPEPRPLRRQQARRRGPGPGHGDRPRIPQYSGELDLPDLHRDRAFCEESCRSRLQDLGLGQDQARPASAGSRRSWGRCCSWPPTPPR